MQTAATGLKGGLRSRSGAGAGAEQAGQAGQGQGQGRAVSATGVEPPEVTKIIESFLQTDPHQSLQEQEQEQGRCWCGRR